MAVSFIFNLKIYLFGNIVLIRNLKYIQKLINLLKFGCMFFLGSVKICSIFVLLRRKLIKTTLHNLFKLTY